MKFTLYLTLLFVVGCAAPKKDDYIKHVQSAKAKQLLISPVRVYLAQGQIDIRGEYDNNDAFEHSSVLYAGDAGMVGLLAQVAAHAALSNNAQNARLSTQQLQANKVLEPLSAVLSNLQSEQLFYPAVELHWQQLPDTSGPQIVSKPIFFLSQDARVLSLKHIVQVEPAGGVVPGKKVNLLYSNLIEVMAAPVLEEQAIEYWYANDGAALTAAIKALYQQSLELALSDIKGELDQAAQAETFKLDVLDKLRIERGNRITSACNQLVIRNLRGWILVAPAPTTEQCNLSS